MKKILLILLSLISVSVYSQRLVYGDGQTVFHNGEFVTASEAAAAPSNMLSNGTFSSGDDWTAAGNWSIGSGVATYTVPTTSLLSQADADMIESLEAETDYTLTFTLTQTGGAGTMAYIQIMNSTGSRSFLTGTEYSPGTVVINFTTTATLDVGGLGLRSFDNFINFTIDDIELTLAE